MNHVRELDGIADKECREVVADQVPVTVGGIELGGKATRVAQGFRRVSTVHHGREAHKHGGGHASGKHIGFSPVAQVVGHRKRTVSPRAARMHDALRDAFAVKALELLQ